MDKTWVEVYKKLDTSSTPKFPRGFVVDHDGEAVGIEDGCLCGEPFCEENNLVMVTNQEQAQGIIDALRAVFPGVDVTKPLA